MPKSRKSLNKRAPVGICRFGGLAILPIRFEDTGERSQVDSRAAYLMEEWRNGAVVLDEGNGKVGNYG